MVERFCGNFNGPESILLQEKCSLYCWLFQKCVDSQYNYWGMQLQWCWGWLCQVCSGVDCVEVAGAVVECWVAVAQSQQPALDTMPHCQLTGAHSNYKLCYQCQWWTILKTENTTTSWNKVLHPVKWASSFKLEWSLKCF